MQLQGPKVILLVQDIIQFQLKTANIEFLREKGVCVCVCSKSPCGGRRPPWFGLGPAAQAQRTAHARCRQLPLALHVATGAVACDCRPSALRRMGWGVQHHRQSTASGRVCRRKMGPARPGLGAAGSRSGPGGGGRGGEPGRRVGCPLHCVSGTGERDFRTVASALPRTPLAALPRRHVLRVLADMNVSFVRVTAAIGPSGRRG